MAPVEINEEVTSKGPESRTVIHNILVLVYGSGRVYGYDLNVATESSSVIMFLKDKYPVVI
ncbi:hypothetical protein BGZ58_004387, partial [Dissophora ornata]